MPRFFIVDPQLRDYEGHHFECSQTTAEAIRRFGLEPVVLAHKDFSIGDTNGVRYRPWFRHRQHSGQENAWRIDLRRALEEEKIGADDHVFLHTLYITELEHLFALMELAPPAVMPHWHVLFIRDLDEHGLYDRYVVGNLFRRLNHLPVFAAKLNIYTDTLLMREEYLPYAALVNKDVYALPAPLRHTLPVAERKHGASDPIRVSYLGDARKEKGYAHLPQAVDYVLKHLPPHRKVEFVIQSGFNRPGGEPGMLAARTALEAMPHVQCPVGPLTTQEYYGLLQAADIVVLPHDPRPFFFRSSGTLPDAVGAGKVTVVSERCWLTTQVDETRAVTFSAYSQLGPAICRAIENFESLQAKAVAYAKPYQKENSPDALVARLMKEKPEWKPQPVGDPAKKKALVVCNDWLLSPFCGPNLSGRRQFRYLREQGYEVHVLVSMPMALKGFPHMEDLRMDCENFCSQHGVDRLWYSWFSSDKQYGWGGEGNQSTALATLGRYADNDLISEFRVRENYTIDPVLVEFAKESPFEFIMLNHVFNMPLIDKLGLKNPTIICDTHDYMSRNRAEKRGDTAVDPDEDQMEMNALARCKGIIAVSAEEKKLFKDKLPPHMKSAHLIPPPLVMFDPAEATAGCLNMLDVVQAAGIMDIKSIELLVKFLEKQQHIQLLFVSSNHPQAVQSFAAFYNEVFVPFLKAQGVIVTVAGTMRPPYGLPKNEMQIQFLGRVKDLAPLYAASRVVILPIYFGTGTSIKSVEALAYGRPVLGTPLAFRGFKAELYNEAAPLIANDPQKFGGKILELLADVEKRKANAAQVHKLWRYLRWSDYSHSFSKLISECIPEFHAVAPPPEPAQELPPYFEFGGDALGFNIMLRLVLLGGQLAPGDATQMLEAMRNPARRALFEKIFDSFFVTRTAPMAQGFEKSGFFLDAVRWGGRSFEDFKAFLESRVQAAA
jgi:glycosyltransferase involved in cell wall biosynthesis